MKDKYGRNIDYMRISITDRCNLRCGYCMPKEGVPWIAHDEILRFEEIVEVVRKAAVLGIKKIKITGGEPLVRSGVESLITDIKSIDGIEQVTLTTNGVLLEERLPNLIRAGIDGINISLDTLEPVQYREMTGRDSLEAVLSAIEAAVQAGVSLKINSVIIKGINENQICGLARFASDRNIVLRFIELMPIGLGKNFDAMGQEAIMARLEAEFGKGKPDAAKGNGPATYYSFGGCKIGFISALSHKFCESCNRVRLTSDGKLKLCLQYSDGVDLKPALRQDGNLQELIEKAVFSKPRCHSFGSGEEAEKEKRIMSQIGG